MIVVDSSVWIANLRNQRNRAVERLYEVNPSEILVGDVIMLEVMRGAKSEQEARQLERYLRMFKQAEMLGLELALQAAANYRLLRTRGITIRSSIDMIIATFCIKHGYLLLQHDRDFQPMSQHLGLQLA
ncbi:PIN domain nuclease [Tianweitania sp. BSSL-BM11]|uniref:PIN domain nuclease n=1 Tax=Tianweitania aestuarii TaxID=2814886 RepID=A0ABS5RYU7_9HYPH|nr:PIN domain nuclease [Tianweitania aestuarii]